MHQLFDDGEAETGSALAAAPALVHSVEAVEDAADLVCGNAGAVVDDRDLDVLLALDRTHDNAGAGGRVLDRVVHEVEHGAIEQVAVRLGFDILLAFDAKGDVLRRCDGAELTDDLLRDGIQIHRLWLGYDSFRGREEEEIVAEACEPLGLGFQRRHEFVELFGTDGGVHLRHLNVRAQGSERCAQLVRCILHELALVFERLLDARDHRIEGVSEGLEFVVRALVIDALAEVGSTNAGSDLGDIANRAEEHAGEHVTSDAGSERETDDRDEGKALEPLKVLSVKRVFDLAHGQLRDHVDGTARPVTHGLPGDVIKLVDGRLVPAGGDVQRHHERNAEHQQETRVPNGEAETDGPRQHWCSRPRGRSPYRG